MSEDGGVGAGERVDGGDRDESVRARAGVPEWDDEYLDRVADRLLHGYDLEKAVRVRPPASGDGGAAAGEAFDFDLAGELRVESSKHLFHPSVQYATHRMREYVYATRRPSLSVSDLERLVDLGHDLAAERVDPSEQHKATEFTFVVVAPEIPDDVRAFVEGFRDRTLLKYGLHGHYEVHLCVVAPDREDVVASERTEIDGAFALWEPIDAGRSRGLLGRLRALLGR